MHNDIGFYNHGKDDLQYRNYLNSTTWMCCLLKTMQTLNFNNQVRQSKNWNKIIFYACSKILSLYNIDCFLVFAYIIKHYLEVSILLQLKNYTKEELFLLSFVDNYIAIKYNNIVFQPLPIEHYNTFLNLLQEKCFNSDIWNLIKYWFYHFQSISFDMDLIDKKASTFYHSGKQKANLL